jgi:hypothetical protein
MKTLLIIIALAALVAPLLAEPQTPAPAVDAHKFIAERQKLLLDAAQAATALPDGPEKLRIIKGLNAGLDACLKLSTDAVHDGAADLRARLGVAPADVNAFSPEALRRGLPTPAAK